MISTAINMVFQNFNPRAHEGYDHDFFTNEKLPFNSFNPRTHGGYDGVAPRNCNQQPRFNPRTHGGYDSEII